MIDDGRFGHGFAAFGAIENWNRNAPHALSRNTPVGPAFQHVAHAYFAPGRKPFDALGFAKGSGTQRSFAFRKVFREVAAIATVFVLLNCLDDSADSAVHGDEPLWRGAKDHRI